MKKHNLAEQIEKNKTIKGYLSIFKQRIVNNRTLLLRFLWLFVSAFFGIYLALWWFKGELLPFCSIIREIVSFKESIGNIKSRWLDSSLTTLLLALPTLLLLWVFRTHDTREQINKTHNNTLTSILTHALDMITSNDLKRRSMGLIQLAQLKKQTKDSKDFDAQIDAATRRLDLSTDLTEGVSLSKSVSPLKFESSLFIDSTLENMDLSGANIRDGNLFSANLSGIKLVGADLSGANLSGANLIGANLIVAYLIGANLSGAKLIGAYLGDAKLNSADLSGANLSGANLRGANLSYANLSGANLNGAILSDTTDFLEARYDDETQFPEGFNLETKGMFKVLKSRFGS